MVETGGHGLLTSAARTSCRLARVPYDTPELSSACLRPAIIGELEWQPFSPGQVVAITGSNGKTTPPPCWARSSPMRRPNSGRRKHWHAGHRPHPQSTPQTTSVLEVSSFQLETVEQFRPHIAVVLNITQDHLDRHGSFENYAAMKADHIAADRRRFLRAQRRGQATQMLAARTKAQVFWFSGRRAIKQGAFVHGESVVFLPREGAKPEPVMPWRRFR